jgi:hypothetical protein
LFFNYYCPKFAFLADMFAAAALAAAPQLVRDDAPVPCPGALATILTKAPRFEAQFRKTDIDWVDSDAISSQDRDLNLAVVRTRFGPTAKMVNLDESQFLLLANTVWIVPDGRRCPHPASTDPIAAGIQHLSSMAVFKIIPLPLIPEEPMAVGNMFWQATRIANKILPSEGQPAVDIPLNITVTFAQILKGYSAFTSFRDTFADIAWPEDVIFLESTLDGRPVSVRTLAAQFGPVPAVARAGPGVRAPDPGADPLADADRIAREAKIKQATKDYEDIARFRGMFESSSFTALFGDDAYPTLTGTKGTLSEMLRSTVPELTITDSQAEKFLKTKFGSTRGVTDPDRISVTLFAQKRTTPELNITDFIIMLNRFRDCAFAVFGTCARFALETLGTTVTNALYPVTGDNPHSAVLGLPAAIDIINDAMTRVGHSALLQPLTGLNRWLPPMTNVSFGSVWVTGLHLQSTAMMEAIAAAAVRAPSNKRPASTAPPNARNARAKKGRGTPAPPTPSSAPPPVNHAGERCRQQDAPGGCSYGLRCRFRHDTEHPKKDAAGAAARA